MEKENKEPKLKNDFLAAYHSILFSKKNDNDADVERRRLAVKYLTASTFESEHMTAPLLGQGLKQYRTLVEKIELIKKIPCPENEERANWKSNLKDVRKAISLVKLLPCQRNSLNKPCGRRELTDRDIESTMRMPECSNEAQPARKIASAHLGKITLQSSKKIQERSLYSHQNGQSSNRKLTRQLENKESLKEDDENKKSGAFKSARTELQIQQQQKTGKKSLGGKASINSKFVCPLKRDKISEDNGNSAKDEGTQEDERLKGIEEKLIELVRNEIMDNGTTVTWDDVAGLEHAKKIIKEIVVLPMLRPDIFTGLRRPPKGILLFGPPGTGKTLIGKCIASQSKSTFFSISASSLTSKWIGEGEKMVRALFAVARVYQPSVIFIDEIDSLLTQRSETEHESSRRIKTEFLVQLDGAATGEEDRILVIGATNRPQELDEAARRRFVKRLYVPLPEFEARRQIVVNLLAAEMHELTERDIDNIANLSEHYSGADMTNLCKEASMGPIRSIPFELLENIRKEDVRCVTADDFSQALTYVRPSVSQSDLGLYVNWDRTYGSGTSSYGSSKPPH